jgi:hypothetical protein
MLGDVAAGAPAGLLGGLLPLPFRCQSGACIETRNGRCGTAGTTAKRTAQALGASPLTIKT